MLYSESCAPECQIGVVTSVATATLPDAVWFIGCGRWECASCGPLRRAEFTRRALNLPKSYATLKSLTLTAPVGSLCGRECLGAHRGCGACVRVFNRRWRRLYQWLRRKYAVGRKTIWANEFGPANGHLHKHVIADVGYLDQRLLSRTCVHFGLGRIVHIKAVDSRLGAVKYLAKYLAKMSTKREAFEASAKTWIWARGARRVQSAKGLREVHEKSEREYTVQLRPRLPARRESPVHHAIWEPLAMEKRAFDNARLEREAETPEQLRLPLPPYLTRWSWRKSASTDAVRGQETVL